MVELHSSGVLPTWQTHDGDSWGHRLLFWLAPAPGSLHIHICEYEVHVYAVYLCYITVGLGCGTFFSCRPWVLSPNAGDNSEDRLCRFSPVLLPAALCFPSFSNGGKLVSAGVATQLGTGVWPSIEAGVGLHLNIS